MSDQDQVKPYHARDTAPGQEAADVVAEVLAHAAEREQAAAKKTAAKTPPKWMLPVTVNLGVLAAYFLIAQPDFLILNPVDDPRSDAEVVQQSLNAVYFDGIMKIQIFEQANGRLPTTLEEAGSGLAAQGVEYSTQGDSTYILIIDAGGEVITFDSAVDDPADLYDLQPSG